MQRIKFSALCTLGALAFNLGCTKNTSNETASEKSKYSSVSSGYSSTTLGKNVQTNKLQLKAKIDEAYAKIQLFEIPYEELNEIEDKMNYIEASLTQFNVKIQKINEKKEEKKEEELLPKYRITSTLYPAPIDFDTIDHLQKKVQLDIYNHLKSERIQNFEKEYQVNIKPLLGSQNYTFELTADWLHEKMFFKDLGSLEAAVKNGYHIQKVDNITKLFRIIRNKSFKNVSTLSPFNAQKAFVIDGADDLATAMESSGLSQKLIYIIQGIGFYPAFLYLVYSGTEGATAQHQDLRQEVKELLLQNYEQELKLKQTLQSLIQNDPVANAAEIQKIYFDQIKFKVNLLQMLNNVTKDNESDKLTKTIQFLESELQKPINVDRVFDKPIAELPNDIRNILIQLQNLPEFDPKNSKSMDLIIQLNEFKNTQEDIIKTYIEQKIPGALTEGGLMAMFSGMAAFEIRAVIGYAHLELFKEQLKGKTKEEIQSLIKESSFLNDFSKFKDGFLGSSSEPLFAGALGILTKLGDGFLALGQAQMFLGGLINIANDINEVRTLREWISIVENSELWKNTNNETKQLRGILADFYKKQSILVIFKTTGDIALTAGQFAMLMGGPLVFEKLPATVAGASATILGVATKQTFEKIIELYYEFDDAPDNSKEAKIIAGEFDSPEDPPLEKLAKRIEMLNKLTMERSKLRVWQKLYLEVQKRSNLNTKILNNPNYLQEKVLPSLRRNFLAGAKYNQYYLNALEELFPDPITDEKKAALEKNLNYLKKASEFVAAAKTQKNSMLLFHRFTVQHLAELKRSIEHNSRENNITSADSINVNKDFTHMPMSEVAQEVKLVFDYLSALGIDSEFEQKVVSRIIKGEGALFGDKNLLTLAQDYITIDKTRVISAQEKVSLLVGATSVSSYYKNYYFPFLDLTPIKNKLSKIFFTSENKSKEKIIYFFDKEKFLLDLENFSTLSEDKKSILSELLLNLFINTPDETKLKAKFGNDKRTPIKKIMDGVYNKISRQETLRPVLKYTLPQLELYDMMKSVMGLTNDSPSPKLNFAKKVASKMVYGMNQANIFVNFYHMPNRIMNIHQQSVNGEHFSAFRNSLEMSLDNLDLGVDLIRGSSFLQKHVQAYKHLGRAQAALNFATAGFEIWNAYDLFKQVGNSTGKQKQDYIVYGTASTLSAVTSIGTLAAIPLTSMAGPIGTAIGFSIMMGQNIYTTIRTHEELVGKFGMPPNDAGKLGAVKLLCPMCDISKSLLFEPYQRDYVKKQELEQHLTELNKDAKTTNVVFTKLVTPKPFYYFPVTPTTSSISNCNMAGCSTSSTGGYVLKQGIHLCQTSNIYNAQNEKIRAEIINNLQLKPYETEHRQHYLNEKFRIDNRAWYEKFFVSYSVYDFTRYCKLEDVKNYVKMDEYHLDQKILTTVPEEKKTILFYVGLGDQYRHGYGVSLINGNQNIKNFFIVEAGQYKYELNGANKDDYFEIKAPAKDTSYINGKEGFNLLSFQNFEFGQYFNLQDKITFVTPSITQIKNDLVEFKKKNTLQNTNYSELDVKRFYLQYALNSANTTKKELLKQFPEVENISHFMGSKFRDIYLGNSTNEVLLGNNGNDVLIGALGDDVLSGGEDIDLLIGGAGKDTYLINKTDFLNSKENYDIIYFANKASNKYNFPYFFTNNENDRDLIITDVYEIGIYSENNDLWFVTNNKEILSKQNDKSKEFVKLFKLENYKENGKIARDIPLLTTKDGNIIVYNPLEATNTVSWLNTISTTSQSKIDTKDLTNLPGAYKGLKGIRLDKDSAFENYTYINGTLDNEIIIGNKQDNYINASYGNAFIQGLEGNDVLMANLDHSKREKFVRMDGGSGDDIFVVNVVEFNSYDKNNIPFIKIIEDDKGTNDHLLVKVTGNYNHLEYKGWKRNGNSITLLNSKNEILFYLSLPDKKKLNTIQIEIGRSKPVKIEL
ncbi:calcium-binding protein [Pigmentibacter ruber]